MKTIIQHLLFLLFSFTPSFSPAVLQVGIGKVDITPPTGTPSAGYNDRKGEGMQGVHDPLLAIALLIDNGEKKVVFCSVDHLGFTYDMVQEIIKQVQQTPGLEQCEVYIGSSHTHSGGGAYLNIRVIGESLAGPYSSSTTEFYTKGTVEAIVQASQQLIPAKIGIGYGQADSLSRYRGQWPKDIEPLRDVTIIKVTKLDYTPLAVLFNYPVHPTVLKSQNRLFSSDFVGYTRNHLQTVLGSNVQALYFNGAQGDIIPAIFNEENRFEACRQLGESLADTIVDIWNRTETANSLTIKVQKHSYSFIPQPTPSGLTLPLDHYKSELNVIVLNHGHAFLTIPGELSCLYDQQLKALGKKEMGYQNVSILGLTNDAHGYIILPESWKHKTFESNISFGGEQYGEQVKDQASSLLKCQAPFSSKY